ncbi:hypothetical protein M885DRAFT_543900 [Pelagophyceae sp. CCMP2097]|nr:hypothetical protein M885DRAFT_543900 [Pelagophyceae sp. CCMP2097]
MSEGLFEGPPKRLSGGSSTGPSQRTDPSRDRREIAQGTSQGTVKKDCPKGLSKGLPKGPSQGPSEGPPAERRRGAAVERPSK